MPIQLTPIVKVLLIVSFIGFLIQQTFDQFLGAQLGALLGLVPYAFVSRYFIWQILTYPFVHSTLIHLFFNLLMIGWIGSEFERAWGGRRFLRFYFYCMFSTAVSYLVLSGLFPGLRGGGLPLIGTDGIIYGLLTAYAIFYGEQTLYFMMLFSMKAKYFVACLAGFELLSQAYSHGNLTATLANIVTIGAAFLYFVVKRKLPQGSKTGRKFLSLNNKKRSHLKIVSNLDENSSTGSQGPKIWH